MKTKALAVLFLFVSGFLVSLAGEAFAPNQLEACCMMIVRDESPDPKLCGEIPPSKQTCKSVVEDFARAATSHAGRFSSASNSTRKSQTVFRWADLWILLPIGLGLTACAGFVFYRQKKQK
jgi:hypothetical protein